MTFPSKTTGEILTALLKSRGDPFGAAMAESLGVTSMTVYRWKNSKDMKLLRLTQIADYFGYTIYEFLNWEQSNEPDASDTEPSIKGPDYSTRSFT